MLLVLLSLLIGIEVAIVRGGHSGVLVVGVVVVVVVFVAVFVLGCCFS